MGNYFLYIPYSEKLGQFYVGVSHDPEKRLHFHNSSLKGWTRRVRPWKFKAFSIQNGSDKSSRGNYKLRKSTLRGEVRFTAGQVCVLLHIQLFFAFFHNGLHEEEGILQYLCQFFRGFPAQLLPFGPVCPGLFALGWQQSQGGSEGFLPRGNRCCGKNCRIYRN